MQAILAFIRKEPAMLVTVGLAIANMIFTLNAEQQLQVSTILESIILLLGGAIIRENVYSPATVDKMGLTK